MKKVNNDMVSPVTCSKCGKKNEVKENLEKLFCLYCGTQIELNKGEEESLKDEIIENELERSGKMKVNSQELKCIKCGNVLKENQEFCPSCGKKSEVVTDKKKKIIILVSIGIAITIFVTALIVVFLFDGESKSNSSNTASGTNEPQLDSHTSEQISENITSSGGLTEEGILVVFSKNENEVPIDMEIEVEFYDEAGLIVGSGSTSLSAVGTGSEVATEIYSTPEKFDDYKIYVDGEISEKTSYFDKIEIIHNNNGEEIIVQVKNNSEDLIDWISVSVVYFQGDDVVGISSDLDVEIESGRAGNFTLYFPYDENYDDVSFESYKVFVNEVYTW